MVNSVREDLGVLKRTYSYIIIGYNFLQIPLKTYIKDISCILTGIAVDLCFRELLIKSNLSRTHPSRSVSWHPFLTFFITRRCWHLRPLHHWRMWFSASPISDALCFHNLSFRATSRYAESLQSHMAGLSLNHCTMVSSTDCCSLWDFL